MGACSGKSAKQRNATASSDGTKNKKSTSMSLYHDSPMKRNGEKLSIGKSDDKIETKMPSSSENDKYYQKYQISEADFKELAASKSAAYYAIFFKFRNLADQLGELSPETASSKLIKNIAKLKLIKDKVERYFQTAQYIPSSKTIPIVNDEVILFTIKYGQVLVEVLDVVEKDPKYEGLYPILSFSFKDIKTKLQAVLAEIQQVKTNSAKPTKNNNQPA